MSDGRTPGPLVASKSMSESWPYAVRRAEPENAMAIALFLTRQDAELLVRAPALLDLVQRMALRFGPEGQIERPSPKLVRDWIFEAYRISHGL